jgi:hypothetical protein
MSKYVLALMALLLVGCVEVGGTSVGVDTCTGTECGDGNTDSSTTDAIE